MQIAETRDSFDLLDILSLGAVIIGYLLSVIYPSHLTLTGFALLTAAKIGWVVIYMRMGSRENTGNRVMIRRQPCSPPLTLQRDAVLLALCSLVGLGTAKLGMGVDWFFPVITVGVIGAILPLRQASVLNAGILVVSCYEFLSCCPGTKRAIFRLFFLSRSHFSLHLRSHCYCAARSRPVSKRRSC